MNMTFGICISPETNVEYANNLLDSIRKNWKHPFISIGNYEILVIGTPPFHIDNGDNLIHIPFNENNKKGWITAKKNILAKAAKYENLCILHDYYLLDDYFHHALRKFDDVQDDWEILVPKILTKEGTRHSDWLFNNHLLKYYCDKHPWIADELRKVAPHENHPMYVCGIPYTETRLKYGQYISGGCMICKTEWLINHPWNERLGWGDAEDIQFSENYIDNNTKLFMVEGAIIQVQKSGKWKVYEMPQSVVDYLVREHI